MKLLKIWGQRFGVDVLFAETPGGPPACYQGGGEEPSSEELRYHLGSMMLSLMLRGACLRCFTCGVPIKRRPTTAFATKIDGTGMVGFLCTLCDEKGTTWNLQQYADKFKAVMAEQEQAP